MFLVVVDIALVVLLCAALITNYLNSKKIVCLGKEVVVKCPINNCEFTGELSLIENHLKTCDKNPTNSPYFEIGRKNDEALIDDMKDHLRTEISCHTKLLLDFINNLRNEMESIKNEIVDLKSENKHLKIELEIIQIDSKNNQMKNEEFEKKIKENLSEIEELNEEMIYIKNENRSMMNKLNNIEESRINEAIAIMHRKSEQQTREIDEMKEKCEQTKNKEIEMRRIIDEIDLMKKSNINNYDERINNLQSKIIKMERFTEINNNFTKFEWKIENLSNQQQQRNIYSESFYSYINGYKICLSELIYGGFDRYCVVVYFHLMRGEFDNDLLWPFKHVVTIDITNQIDGTVYTSKSINLMIIQIKKDGINQQEKEIKEFV